jgi:hypothetical protein
VSVGAWIVNEPCALDEFEVPVIVAVVLDATATVVIAAVPLVAPAAIVSVDDVKVAAVVLDDKVTG